MEPDSAERWLNWEFDDANIENDVVPHILNVAHAVQEVLAKAPQPVVAPY
jgi:hypothetical protein